MTRARVNQRGCIVRGAGPIEANAITTTIQRAVMESLLYGDSQLE